MVTHRTVKLGLGAAILSLSTLVAGYGPKGVNASVPQSPPDPAKALGQLLNGHVYSSGPYGEKAASMTAANMTAAQIARVRSMHATAAIALHYGGNDWSTAQVDGLEHEFAALGIKVIGVTDANFKPDKQVSDIQTLLTKKPTIMVSIPTDPVATAGAYKAAEAQGVKLVFMDNVPSGMRPGKDYVSVVSADNCGNGIASAYLLAQKLHEQGKIGLIYHAADFFVTKQRYTCFKRTIQQYPGIQILQEQGIAGPDFAGQADSVASAMVTRYPTLNAIWAVWDVPAEGVVSALRAAGRPNIAVATEDLGLNVAVDMAKGQFVTGLGAQRPFDQGTTEAKLAALSLLHVKVPGYVALPALPVTHSNVMSAWQAVYHHSAPSALVSAYHG
jgi:ribose transport system substrate-binding protein